jgi:signal transduction histidine kinase
MPQELADKLELFFQAVFSTRKEPLIFSNAHENEYLQQFEIPDWHKANHMVCIPLWRGNNFFGVIYMVDKLSGLPFFREDIVSAQIIAYQLLSSLENVRLTEEKLRMDRLSTIGNMAGEIIHDLKGPMTSILGFAELLESQDCTTEEQQEFSRIIVSEVEQMVEMVEEILEFSRGDKMKLNLQPCDVGEFVAEIVEVLGRHFSDHQIQIVTKLTCKEKIYADREKLKRVFSNIANNAKDAIQGHGKFSINTYPHENTHVEFRLADSGVGIPPHVRENIFEPFVTYGKKRGTGLGMSITKKIIEDHGGKIWVVSEEGKGTIFYFTVPFAKSV